MATIRGLLTVLVLFLATVCLFPGQWLAIKFGWPIQRQLPFLWHQIAIRMLDLRIHQVGSPATDRPLLITANHASWVDITAIGSLMPLSFIAKSEVGGWPIFGLLARLQRTVFVNRTRRTETGKATNEIAERMREGDAMVLFAEGTSSDGNMVLPFRSALLGAATKAQGEDTKVWVQPLTIVYHSLHGMPMGRVWRPRVAWYGDMELGEHLWGVFTHGPMDVVAIWGEPVLAHSQTDRKQLSKHLEDEVRDRLIRSLRDGIA
ncbi:MAG: 1-acyl-sn-glycerol-3-phosphate acyltransferase [Rhodobacteraceae bacterium]|nr:1-acyl-sn-glycerol-3-phosphate acyltransferase [Paracoccaceae bacterium]